MLNVFTIKETFENGATKEMVFTNKNEAVEALRDLLGVQKTEAERQREARQQLNDSLRSQWRRGTATSTGDVQALFDKARRDL